MDILTYALLKKKITESSTGADKLDKAVYDADKLALNEKLSNIDTDLTTLFNDKLDTIGYTVKSGIITQADANEIINSYTTYDGHIIVFVSNSESPNKTLAYGGVAMTNKADKYLLEFNNGIVTKWTVDRPIQMSISKDTYDALLQKLNTEIQERGNAVAELNSTIETQASKIENLASTKQDKILAGAGINIAEDGKTINADVGSKLYKHTITFKDSTDRLILASTLSTPAINLSELAEATIAFISFEPTATTGSELIPLKISAFAENKLYYIAASGTIKILEYIPKGIVQDLVTTF